MLDVGQLAVRVRPLGSGESLARAADAIRASPYGAVPVVEYGCLTGLLTSRSLAEFVAHQVPTEAAEEVGRDHRVADVLSHSVIAIPAALPLREALLFMQTNRLDVAPVLDRDGTLLGLISTGELISSLYGRGRLPVIGGMATPFGVYLTGGGARGGVGDLALFSAGVYLFILQVVALLGAEWLVREAPAWLARVPQALAWLQAGRSYVVNGVALVIFALMFRLSWITGYHAAEHQVVHALEAGDELRPDVVARKPRVHPRCGTNLTVAIMIISALWYWDWLRNSLNEWTGGLGVVVAMFLVLYLWRRLGGLAQQYVTTRPATPDQLRSGIVAAEQLIEAYRENPGQRVTPFRRIWNMGLLQVISGALVVLAVLAMLQWFRVLPAWITVY